MSQAWIWGLDGGFTGEAAFDARELLGGSELLGDHTKREAGRDTQVAEHGAITRAGLRRLTVSREGGVIGVSSICDVVAALLEIAASLV